MKLRKYKEYRCTAIVQPGEYVIDNWDNKQCESRHTLYVCEHCDEYFCLEMHWHKHLDTCEAK